MRGTDTGKSDEKAPRKSRKTRTFRASTFFSPRGFHKKSQISENLTPKGDETPPKWQNRLILGVPPETKVRCQTPSGEKVWSKNPVFYLFFRDFFFAFFRFSWGNHVFDPKKSTFFVFLRKSRNKLSNRKKKRSRGEDPRIFCAPQKKAKKPIRETRFFC